MTDFATILRAQRQAKGLSQAKAAEILGITPQTLRNWESGRTAPPEHPQLTQGEAFRRLHFFGLSNPSTFIGCPNLKNNPEDWDL